MKYLTTLLIIVFFTTISFFGYTYFKQRSTLLGNNTLTQEVINNEDLNVQVVEIKISNSGSCRTKGSVDDIYPPGKYQVIKEFTQDVSWKCVGGGYGGDTFICSGKEVPASRIHANVGDVIDVCNVRNNGSISEPKWVLDVGRNTSSPVPNIPLSYVKKVPDTTPVSY